MTIDSSRAYQRSSITLSISSVIIRLSTKKFPKIVVLSSLSKMRQMSHNSWTRMMALSESTSNSLRETCHVTRRYLWSIKSPTLSSWTIHSRTRRFLSKWATKMAPKYYHLHAMDEKRPLTVTFVTPLEKILRLANTMISSKKITLNYFPGSKLLSSWKMRSGHRRSIVGMGHHTCRKTFPFQ